MMDGSFVELTTLVRGNSQDHCAQLERRHMRFRFEVVIFVNVYLADFSRHWPVPSSLHPQPHYR